MSAEYYLSSQVIMCTVIHYYILYMNLDFSEGVIIFSPMFSGILL